MSLIYKTIVFVVREARYLLFLSLAKKLSCFEIMVKVVDFFGSLLEAFPITFATICWMIHNLIDNLLGS